MTTLTEQVHSLINKSGDWLNKKTRAMVENPARMFEVAFLVGLLVYGAGYIEAVNQVADVSDKSIIEVVKGFQDLAINWDVKNGTDRLHQDSALRLMIMPPVFAGLLALTEVGRVAPQISQSMPSFLNRAKNMVGEIRSHVTRS